MTTDLFLSGSDGAVRCLQSAVPPACLCAPVGPPAPVPSGDDVVVEWPWWKPRRATRHLVPSATVLGAQPPAFRFEVSAWMAGTWSPWIGTATLGDAAFPPLPSAVPGLTCDVDQLTAAAPVERVRLRWRLRAAEAAATLGGAWAVTLSASDLAPPAPPETGAGAGIQIPVPPLTQMEAPAEVRTHICSPTSVAMVLRFWGREADALAVAAEVHHRELGLYGVWPAAVRAAGRHDVLGYLLRFPDWEAAAWCLARGLPVIASIRYPAGGLTGAAIAQTAGHLIVLTGYEGDQVLVNDPAAPSAAEVPRRYAREELLRAWLGGTGIGYVLVAARSEVGEVLLGRR